MGLMLNDPENPPIHTSTTSVLCSVHVLTFRYESLGHQDRGQSPRALGPAAGRAQPRGPGRARGREVRYRLCGAPKDSNHHVTLHVHQLRSYTYSLVRLTNTPRHFTTTRLASGRPAPWLCPCAAHMMPRRDAIAASTKGDTAHNGSAYRVMVVEALSPPAVPNPRSNESRFAQ